MAPKKLLTISLRMTPEEIAAVEAEAARRGISKGEYVRKLFAAAERARERTDARP